MNLSCVEHSFVAIIWQGITLPKSIVVKWNASPSSCPGSMHPTNPRMIDPPTVYDLKYRSDVYSIGRLKISGSIQCPCRQRSRRLSWGHFIWPDGPIHLSQRSWSVFPSGPDLSFYGPSIFWWDPRSIVLETSMIKGWISAYMIVLYKRSTQKRSSLWRWRQYNLLRYQDKHCQRINA